MVLSTIGLTALAIAQPILDLLGRSPDFFIARAAPGMDVMLLGILLGVAVPLIVAALVLFASLVRPAVGRAFHLVVLALMGSLIAVSVIRLSAMRDTAWMWTVAVALAVGLVVAWTYHRLEWARSFLSLVAVAPLAVTGAFLFLSPTSEVAWGMETVTGYQSASVGRPAPIVMLVFDEFPIASVIDGAGEIRESDFPGLAELAADATWFRNAVAIRESTRDAIPALLTGIDQVPGERLPHYSDHPSSIFTLLDNAYRVEAIETLTQICPEIVCSDGSREVGDFAERWAALGTDLGIVSGHLLLPSGLSQDLPPIDQNWGNFAPVEVERPEKWSLRDRMKEQLQDDRRNLVARFLAGLEEPLLSTDFRFIHLPLPHKPWAYMADGRSYAVAPPDMPGMAKGVWGDNAFLVEQAYQRHLLQAQYADTIVSSVIDRLRASGSYESSILVVAADHGVAVRPGHDDRNISPETVGDIAAVPLFIKTPGKDGGSVDDYRATVLDVLPTLAGLVGAEVPWAVDGTDLFGSDRPQRTESTMEGLLTKEETIAVTFGVDGSEKHEVVEYHRAYFGDRGPFGLAPLGYAGLLGEPVGEVLAGEEPISAQLDSPELYADVDLEADPLPIHLTGTLEGAVTGGEVLAVTVDSRIVALTESWEHRGATRFRAMLPPAALRSGRNEFGIHVVTGADGDFAFIPVDLP